MFDGCFSLDQFFCNVVCKNFYKLVTVLDLLFPLTFLNFPHPLLVRVLAFGKFTNFCIVSFLVFLKTLCLIALLQWNDLYLVLFIGLCHCFLYSSLTIFSSLSHSSFNHITGGLLFILMKVLGMVLSAACSIFLVQQHYTSSIDS